VVTIGHAGMLSALVQNGLTPALASRGITIRGVKGNSLTVAGNIDNGSLPADLFGNADANANQLLSGAAHGNARLLRPLRRPAHREVDRPGGPRPPAPR